MPWDFDHFSPASLSTHRLNNWKFKIKDTGMHTKKKLTETETLGGGGILCLYNEVRNETRRSLEPAKRGEGHVPSALILTLLHFKDLS